MKPLDIAEFIINYSELMSIKLGRKKLFLLLYLMEGYSLARMESLIDGEFFVYEIGPVISDIYELYESDFSNEVVRIHNKFQQVKICQRDDYANFNLSVDDKYSKSDGINWLAGALRITSEIASRQMDSVLSKIFFDTNQWLYVTDFLLNFCPLPTEILWAMVEADYAWQRAKALPKLNGIYNQVGKYWMQQYYHGKLEWAKKVIVDEKAHNTQIFLSHLEHSLLQSLIPDSAPKTRGNDSGIRFV